MAQPLGWPWVRERRAAVTPPRGGLAQPDCSQGVCQPGALASWLQQPGPEWVLPDPGLLPMNGVCYDELLQQPGPEWVLPDPGLLRMNGVCYDELPQHPRSNVNQVGYSWFPVCLYNVVICPLTWSWWGNITGTSPRLETFDYVQGEQSHSKKRTPTSCQAPQ